MRNLYFAVGAAFLFCALATGEAFAQYRFDHFTSSNGLPQNTVSSITQSRDGYLWFATFDGLVRYDGVRFTIFDKGNTPEIHSNRFLTVCADGDGAVWAGTNDSGMVRYRNGMFTGYTVKNGLPNDNVGRIQLDDNEKARFIVQEKYLLSLSESGTFEAVEEQAARQFVDRTQSRWVFDSGKVIRHSGADVKEFPIPIDAVEFLRFHYQDRAGNLWFSSRKTGIYLVAGNTLRHFTEQDGVPSNQLVRVGGEDRDGNLWLFCDSMLLHYKDGRITPYSAADGLTTHSIRAVLCDRDGTVWIGTNDRGLFRLTRRFLTTYTEVDGVLDRIVYPIYEDHSGTVWIGSGGGLTRFSGGAFTRFPLKRELIRGAISKSIEKEVNNRYRMDVRTILEDRKGRLWLGVNGGLLQFENGKLIDRSAIISGSFIGTIYEDRAGTLWFGTHDGLVKVRDGVVTTFGTEDGLPSQQVTTLYEDRTGALWIGMRGGLAKLTSTPEGTRINSWTTADGLVGDRIRSLYGDEDGAIWIGTFDSGLSRFKDGRFTNYTMRDGLYNNGVFQILEDRRGNFWMSCNRGIYRVSRRQLNDFADGKVSVITCVVYGSEDGMLNTECNGERQPAGVKTRDGRLWFPTQEGVVVIDPEAVPYNPPPPLSSIESVVVDRAGVGFAGSVELEPGQTDLEINYTAPSSIKADYIQFKYRLVGLNDEWIDAGARRSVHYSHLPPGHYTFKVAAASIDGTWSESEATLEINVKPRFYQTGWFLAVCVFGFAAAGASIYGLRVHSLKANEKRLTRTVAERTAELLERSQQLEIANGKLEQLATIDSLTNIANRRRLMEFFAQEWQGALRRQTPISVLLIDVDYFKLYNDSYGHQGGDECLKQIAAVLGQMASRATDLAARYGGEEFAVVLADTDERGALVVAEAIRSCVEALSIPHRGSKVNAYVTLSIGVACLIPDTGSVPEELFAAADRSLYSAKENGRNCCWAGLARYPLSEVV